MAFLRVLLDDKNYKDYLIPAGRTTIGRRSDNDIVINNVGVSNNHARLNFEQNYYLTDLRSSNGTYLNGNKILHAKLTDGDEINFSGVQAIFYK